MISAGSHASDIFYCDKVKALYKLPNEIEQLQAEISGNEKYHSNNDSYKQVIVKTTEGLISSEKYKKYLAWCQTPSSDTKNN